MGSLHKFKPPQNQFPSILEADLKGLLTEHLFVVESHCALNSSGFCQGNLSLDKINNSSCVHNIVAHSNSTVCLGQVVVAPAIASSTSPPSRCIRFAFFCCIFGQENHQLYSLAFCARDIYLSSRYPRVRSYMSIPAIFFYFFARGAAFRNCWRH